MDTASNQKRFVTCLRLRKFSKEFWMITHFVAVFCERNHAPNALCLLDELLWDLEKFWEISVFCEGNHAPNALWLLTSSDQLWDLNAWQKLFDFLDVCYVSSQKPVVLQTILPCLPQNPKVWVMWKNPAEKIRLVRCFLSWRSPWGFLISISKWPRNVERRILCTWGYSIYQWVG